MYRNRGALLPPKAVLPRARSKQIGGVVIFLRKNKVLATPLENNDQSAFIARLSRGGGGAGGHRTEEFNSGNDCFCKSALWETTSLEHSWPLSATVNYS